jgi:hypothetical protein
VTVSIAAPVKTIVDDVLRELDLRPASTASGGTAA